MKDISNKICRLIREKIVNGNIPANTKLLSTRKLAESYHVSQRTILHVLDRLEKESLIERFARSGVYIKGKEINKNDLKTIPIFKKLKIEERANKIYQIIREKIVNGDWQTKTKLLSSRKLAKIYHVSQPTILRVLDRLEKESLIERFTRSGVYIKGSKEDNSNSLAVFKKSRVEKIAEDIISGISLGIFKIGEHLPSQKELRFQYKTSKKTIRQVLDVIAKKDLISQKGSGYMVGSRINIARKKTTNCIFLLGKEPPNKRQFQNTYRKQFFETFESEVQKFGITSIRFIDPDKNFLKAIPKDSTAGFLLDLGYLSYNSNAELQTNLTRMLQDFKRSWFPLVIEDYNGIIRNLSYFKFEPIKNVYPMWRDDIKSARKIGIFLTSLGHKNIAYFAYGDAPWNQWRFLELKNTVEQIIGNKGSVQSFHTIEGLDRLKQKGEFFEKITQKAKQSFNTTFFSTLFGSDSSVIDSTEEAHMEFGIVMNKDHYKEIMVPLFEKALELKNITAWVCSGSLLAVITSEILEAKGIKVPEKISLMGFGNDEHTMAHGITVSDDQRSLAGYLAAHCIIGDLPIKKNKQGLVEYEGSVIVRKSTRRVE